MRLLRAQAADRVRLLASLATGEALPGSDVDLAVEGLAPEAYFPVLAELMALFGTAVDLVRLEEAPPSLRARVEAEREAL